MTSKWDKADTHDGAPVAVVYVEKRDWGEERRKQGLSLSEVSEQDPGCFQGPGPLLSEPMFHDA